MRVSVLPELSVESYSPHALHGETQAWVETNCYIDVWIEVLHALKLEPAACLGMVLANDFDGDQWTFYKPAHEDLNALYGLEVHELNVWRGILDNSLTQLQLGRLVLTEIDSFHLPDTAGTDYRRNHVKTTIAIQAIDLEQQSLGYFHNRSYHRLQGDDFVQLFRVAFARDPAFMPFYAEFVRLDRIVRHDGPTLASLARGLLTKHFARRPQRNPVRAYRNPFLADIEALKGQGLDAYHAYAFANLRQLGSGAELAAYHLRWLGEQGLAGLAPAATQFAALSDLCKTLLLKAARAVSTRKAADLDPLIETIATHWDQAMDELGQALR